jgi:ParB-like nuclease domain/DNA methylase
VPILSATTQIDKSSKFALFERHLTPMESVADAKRDSPISLIFVNQSLSFAPFRILCHILFAPWNECHRRRQPWTTSLKPHPQNPRVHTDKQVGQIAQSIEAFGFNVPIFVDHRQNVVAGHGRLLAARKLGWNTVPVIKLNHLTESQYSAFLIADNRLTENSSWDERLLGEQLKVLSELELDFDLEVTGFEMAEIDVLIDGLETLNEPDPDDLLAAIETSAVSASGDLWQLGKHRVLCGNALITENYERLMDGAKADLVITDPPYNVAIDGHASGLGKVRHREFAMASGEMSSGEFTEFLRKAMMLSRQSSQPGSLAYYFMDWRSMKQILAAGQEVYGEMMNLCVWAKSNGGMGSFYRSAHELIFLFKNGTASHRNNVQLGKFGAVRDQCLELSLGKFFLSLGTGWRPACSPPNTKTGCSFRRCDQRLDRPWGSDSRPVPRVRNCGHCG